MGTLVIMDQSSKGNEFNLVKWLLPIINSFYCNIIAVLIAYFSLITYFYFLFTMVVEFSKEPASEFWMFSSVFIGPLV